MIKEIRYVVEAFFLALIFILFKILPLDQASATGGWLGRLIGPRLAASRKAERNLRLALPGRSNNEYQAIVTGMWDNLGRVIAEYPHLSKIASERMELAGPEIPRAAGETDRPAILFSGHIANWEVPQQYVSAEIKPMASIYRMPNNPWTARLLSLARGENEKKIMIAKSRTSIRQIIEAMNKGRFIGMLIDQKYNEGITAPFFGYPANTSTAFVQLAQKFSCPLIPARIERIKGAHFRLSFYPPLAVTAPDGTALPAEDVIAKAHELLEEWITERPEQWLWLHRRWTH